MSILKKLMWVGIALLGAGCLGVVALWRGEPVNAAWLVVAALCVYVLAQRFYALFIVKNVLGVDSARQTPAYRHNDGLDYVPTNGFVLFGHHFAAIAGAGPLVGPVLAAQMGYLPGTLWLIAGVVLAGAVQDMMVLFLSTRRDGRSLGDMIRTEMGQFAGVVASIGVLLICVIILAVLAMVVVNALKGSPWGFFTVGCTIPIALIMGIYGRFIRPGRIAEMSILGVVLLLAALLGGKYVADSSFGSFFNLGGEQLAVMIIAYGFIASVLPVWLLLAPRDYLSTFLKIGTIALLAAGVIIVHPQLQMPALSVFAARTDGPAWTGAMFPFLFITIACGAVSGFHALVSSGTTPKMIENERQIAPIGYGSMLMESLVGIMALIGACVINPGVYFALNSAAARIGVSPESAAAAIGAWGFSITPDQLVVMAHDLGEKTILSRTGGAPTFAVGMATILSGFLGGKALMAVWYHFAILFEALFILTTVDAGTRVTRFMIQDLAGQAIPAFKDTKAWGNNVIGSGLACAGWGWLLYQGVIDPYGGIQTLWPLFGTTNQMLATIALALCTVALFKMKQERFAWVTVIPTTWLAVCTLMAAWQKVFSPDPAIGFLSHAVKFGAAAAAGQVLAPTKTMEEMHRVIRNDYVDATLGVAAAVIVVVVLICAVMSCNKALRKPGTTVVESEPAGATPEASGA